VRRGARPLDDGMIADVRIEWKRRTGSDSFDGTENILNGQRVGLRCCTRQKNSGCGDPAIDDIRSTRDIERQWPTILSLNSSGNSAHPGRKIVSDVLTRWNRLPADEAAHEILPCCGSTAWAQRMVTRRPLADAMSCWPRPTKRGAV